MNSNLILFEDKDILVCHKSAGVPVQSANARQMDLVSMLQQHLALQSSGQRGTPDQIHVIHRLDQPVEGVLAFAKNKKAAAELSRQITQNTVRKIYHAVCCITDTQKSVEQNVPQTLTDYLVKDGRTNTSRVGRKGEKDAKLSELEYRLIGQKGQLLLARIDLKTGRHHQIRVQMAHAGLPLYGDQKYNPNWQKYRLEEEGLRINTALCAVSLTFHHPKTGKKMTFDIHPSGNVFDIFNME